MKLPAIIFLSAFYIQMYASTAVEFSDKEKSIIYTNAVKLLENYESTINRLGINVVNDVEKAKSDAESLLELFVNRQVYLYNDLDPAHKLSPFYEAETYVSNIILWYPDGITISLDLLNARVSDIIAHEENIYSIDILVNRSINGNYMNQSLNKNVEELTFRIAFSHENKTPGNFKVVGVRSSSSNLMVDYTQVLKEVNSEEFSKTEISKINSELKTVIRDYNNYLTLLADPQESSQDKEYFKTSFLQLFSTKETKVYNDIMPDPPISLISAVDYINSFLADYSGGVKNLSINVDSAKFGKVLKAEDGSFYSYTYADKFFSGSYKGKDLFRKMFPLIFKISFTASGKTFTSFRINSIDISSVNFYEASPEMNNFKKPEIAIKPVTRKGFGMSILGSFGRSSIADKDLSSLTIPDNLHSWDFSPLYGFILGLGINYNFTNNLSVRSGAEFNKYSSKFNLIGKFTDNVLSTDINASKFYKIVEADFDSVVVINYVTIPALVNFTSGKPGKIGFFAEAGIKISIPVNSSYSNNGSYKYSGYYPSNPAVIQYLDLPELGFYSKENIDDTGEANVGTINFAFYGSAGINIPLGYYSSITIGPEIMIGLTDILKDKETFVDIFGKSYAHQPTKISNFGLRISIAYKL